MALAFTVVLRRKGSSRVSYDNIPIYAFVQQPNGSVGPNLLKHSVGCIEQAKREIEHHFANKMGGLGKITFVDETAE